MFESKCKIVKVIDGDTTDVDIDLGFGVWLKKQRIRFFGIDTPESRTRDLEEKKYGLAAKKYVTDHMPLGSTQTLVTVKDGKGKYGRILGQFKMEDGSILNDNMIAEHHAVAYFGQSKDDIEEEHIVNRSFHNL
jgi:micrococcal nuclease